jgi:hypothetical protein
MHRGALLLVGASALFLLNPIRPMAQQAAAPGWEYSKLDTTISIDPIRGSLRISGDGEIVITGAPTSDFRLRINGNWHTLNFDSVNIAGATVDTNILDASHKAWRIADAHFSKEVEPGTRLPIHFEIIKDQDSFPLAVKPNVAVAISDADWYPMPLEGNSELPPGKLIFHLPLNWHAAPMGVLIGEEHTGNQNFETFESPRSRRRAFIAARYKVYRSKSDTGTNSLYLLDAPVNNVSLLNAFDQGRHFLEEMYGPLPFRDYRIAEMPNDAVPWYGASEEGLIISRNEMMTSEQGLLGSLVHELAHSWWGNKVRPSGPGSYLLNEGIAAFSGMKFFEKTFGHERTIEESEFGSPISSPDTTLVGYVQLWFGGKDTAISQLESSKGDHYNIAQSKGVWVLRMLCDRVGEKRFYSTMRGIIANDPTLTVPMFRQAMIDSAPEDKGMNSFLAQWLDQPGIPVLDVRWRNTTKDEKTSTTLSVFQGQASTPYTFTVDLKLITRKGILLRSLNIQGVESRFEFEVPDDVVGVQLDPDHKLLIWKPEYGSYPSSSH